MKKVICIALYNAFAKHLPKSNARLVGTICKKTRAGLAKGFITYCGKNVNLQKQRQTKTTLKKWTIYLM